MYLAKLQGVAILVTMANFRKRVSKCGLFSPDLHVVLPVDFSFFQDLVEFPRTLDCIMMGFIT